VYQIDIKFNSQLQPATQTLLVVLYGGKTIPRWRTAAILKIDIPPYLSIRFACDNCALQIGFMLCYVISVKNHPILMKFCIQQQILNWMNVT